MDDPTIRLSCIKLARPDGVMNPDATQIIARAEAFYEFVTQATELPADKVETPASKPVARSPRS